VAIKTPVNPPVKAPKVTPKKPIKVKDDVEIVQLRHHTTPFPKTTETISVLQTVDLPAAKELPDADDGGSTGLIVGIFFGMVLTGVLIFVGLKRLDAIRRRREYRRMNDFLIDGMYNDA
jgi:hypothetical protein